MYGISIFFHFHLLFKDNNMMIIYQGILEREQEQSVVYGSIDFGKTIVTHSKYLDLLQKAGNQLKILPHKVTYWSYFEW